MNQLILNNVSIIDGISPTIKHEKSIVIENDTIKSIKPKFEQPVTDALFIDLTGKTVIPGLIDTHMHASLTTKKQLTYYLDCGVTTIRDVGASLTKILKLSQEFSADFMSKKQHFPRLLYTGPLIDGPKKSYDKPELNELIISVKDDVSIKHELDNLLNNGVHAIKLYYGLNKELTKKIVSYVNGRCPIIMHCGLTKALEAAHIGVDSIEHVMLSIHHDLVGTKLFETYEGIENKNYWKKVIQDWEDINLSSNKIKTFIAALADSKVGLCSTLSLLWLGYIGIDAARNDPLRNLIDTTFINKRDRLENIDIDLMPPLYNPIYSKKAVEKQLEFLNLFHSKGGLIVGGTDFGANYYPPAGYGLQKEISLLSLAIGEMEALKSVTSIAARLLNKGEKLGQLKPGYLADIVVLNNNPLLNINYIENIHSVYSNGKKVR